MFVGVRFRRFSFHCYLVRCTARTVASLNTMFIGRGIIMRQSKLTSHIDLGKANYRATGGGGL